MRVASTLSHIVRTVKSTLALQQPAIGLAGIQTRRFEILIGDFMRAIRCCLDLSSEFGEAKEVGHLRLRSFRLHLEQLIGASLCREWRSVIVIAEHRVGEAGFVISTQNVALFGLISLVKSSQVRIDIAVPVADGRGLQEVTVGVHGQGECVRYSGISSVSGIGGVRASQGIAYDVE